MIDPKLITEARRLLNQARLIPEARASQTSPIGHAPPGSKFPPGAFVAAPPSTLEACGNRINEAIATGSDHELRSANQWCAAELHALTHSSAGAESQLEFRERLIRDYEGQLAGVVARAEMTSITTVRKIRAEAGREPRTGRRLAGEGMGRG